MMKFGFGAGPAAALLFTAPGFAQDKASPAPGGAAGYRSRRRPRLRRRLAGLSKVGAARLGTWRPHCNNADRLADALDNRRARWLGDGGHTASAAVVRRPNVPRGQPQAPQPDSPSPCPLVSSEHVPCRKILPSSSKPGAQVQRCAGSADYMHVDSKAPLRRGFLLGFPARGVRGGIGHAKKILERLIYLGNSGGERPTSDVGLSSDGGTTRRSTRNSRSDAPNISLAAEQAAINVVFVDAWPWRWASGSRSGKSSHARGAQGDGNAVIRTSGRPADAPKHDGFQAGNLRSLRWRGQAGHSTRGASGHTGHTCKAGGDASSCDGRRLKRTPG